MRSLLFTFVQICCVIVIVNGYMNSPKRSILDGGVFRPPSGQIRTIHWPSAKPVPIQKEIDLMMSGTLLRKGEFGPLRGSRALEVELECAELGLSFNQALSIRKQLMMGKLLQGYWKLKDESIMKSIIHKFEHQQMPLLEISAQIDLPPVSILREIVAPRVISANSQPNCNARKFPTKRVIKSIIDESRQDNVNSFLSGWEIKELQNAKENDVVGYKSNCTAADDWEKQIYTFLDKQGISYVTEDYMRLQGYDTKTTGTPDCLIVDDLLINGHAIRWIEFKSFYGSGLKENSYFTKKTVSRQVKKYQAEFGESGAVILKNGFSNKISERWPSTLFLDSGPLSSCDEYNSL